MAVQTPAIENTGKMRLSTIALVASMSLVVLAQGVGPTSICGVSEISGKNFFELANCTTAGLTLINLLTGSIATMHSS